MQNERILAYQLSQKIPDEEIQDISAAGSWTQSISGQASHDGEIWHGRKPHLTDGVVDVRWDF